MFGPWTPLISLVAALLALLLAKRWVTSRLAELSWRWAGDQDLALLLYFVIVLPGVVIHELSHWLMARVLGVRVSKLSLGPRRQGRSRRVSLGSVRVGKVDPVRASLIGLAPLLGGTAAILLIGYLVLDVAQVVELLAGRGVGGFFEALGELLSVPDSWLWLYLIFGISNAMLPSESDMASVRPVLIFLTLLTATVLIVGGIPSVPPDIVRWVNTVAGYLATAFGLTLVVDLMFMIVVSLLLWVTRWLQDG